MAEWNERMACAAYGPDHMLPERGDNEALCAAKRVCEGCPVREPCVAMALGQKTIYRIGVIGGLSSAERRRMKPGDQYDDDGLLRPVVFPRMPAAAVCGSPGGARRHRRAGEQPCDECLAAATAARRERRESVSA